MRKGFKVVDLKIDTTEVTFLSKMSRTLECNGRFLNTVGVMRGQTKLTDY